MHYIEYMLCKKMPGRPPGPARPAARNRQRGAGAPSVCVYIQYISCIAYIIIFYKGYFMVWYGMVWYGMVLFVEKLIQ